VERTTSATKQKVEEKRWGRMIEGEAEETAYSVRVLETESRYQPLLRGMEGGGGRSGVRRGREVESKNGGYMGGLEWGSGGT